MNIEIALVEDELEKCGWSTKGSDSKYTQVRDHMVVLIKKFKVESDDSDYDFSISRDMMKVLFEILTNDDEKVFEQWVLDIGFDKDTASAIRGLRLLTNEEDCCTAIFEIQEAFSGRCLGLAAGYVEAKKGMFSLFSKGQTENKALEGVENESELVINKFEEVASFCSKYRVSIS